MKPCWQIAPPIRTSEKGGSKLMLYHQEESVEGK